MPRRSKGPRLWLRKERRGKSGRLVQNATWVILDTINGRHEESTGCGVDDRTGAERALAEYLARKHLTQVSKDERDPANIPVADVLALYAHDIAGSHARPRETAQRITALLAFFGDRMLSDINGALCRKYVRTRTTDAAARRELEDLRAAINHHRREGLCSKIIEVVLPPEHPARDRWLTRSEAARLIWAAWRYREKQKGLETDRRPRQHIARFILVALYTGTRTSAVCSAALEQIPGHGWIDLKRGVFYRRPAGKRETKKRQPPVPLPDRLLAHLRRWKRNGQRYAVEWDQAPIKRISKALAHAVGDAKLGPDVVPHTLRHTTATWLMQAGTDVWEAAGYLGMTVEMLSARYGHHHPDHLSDARTAFERMRSSTHYVGESVGGKKVKVK
jgi:integrase